MLLYGSNGMGSLIVPAPLPTPPQILSIEAAASYQLSLCLWDCFSFCADHFT